MRWFAPALCVLLLSGCSGVKFQPAVGEVEDTDPGLPGLTLVASMDPHAMTWTFVLRNSGTAAYRIHDDCGERWWRVRVLDSIGTQVYPSTYEISCAMLSTGFDLAPGQSDRASFTWNGEDARGDLDGGGAPRPQARDGEYHVRIEGRADGHDATLVVEQTFTKGTQ